MRLRAIAEPESKSRRVQCSGTCSCNVLVLDPFVTPARAGAKPGTPASDLVRA